MPKKVESIDSMLDKIADMKEKIRAVIGESKEVEVMIDGVKMKATGSLNAYGEQIRKNAESKGYPYDGYVPLEYLCLIHREISEAAEELRKEAPCPHYVGYEGKLKGWAVELVDAMIYIMGYLSYHSIDIDQLLWEKMQYNSSRPVLHGGKVK